ncbi:hypothetical protein LGM35_29690 [Burkholderia cenocepacia]|uniref:hypothetical protein n=1 Tax=Burkholderia cenocepacia TaxID=95486 RepID=UPI001CF1D3BF|nr:hypothetical protein [Burkholderia cenocepacia]MCA7926696.1 hypothetical protein [Burkholderia cenocepacia]
MIAATLRRSFGPSPENRHVPTDHRGRRRVGKTLGNLIVANLVVDVGQIYDRDIACARAAVAFVGAGRPVDDLDRVEPADIWLLSVPDTRIRSP